MKLFEEIVMEEIVEEPTLKFRDVYPQTNMELLHLGDPLLEEISSIAQFVLAPFLFGGTNGEFGIPVPTPSVEEIVLKQIAPHFRSVKKINSENRVVLSMKAVKESSMVRLQQLLEQDEMNPIVKEIYSPGNTNWGGTFRAKEYRVNLHYIKKITKYDIFTLWDFFNHTFITVNGGMAILPSDWSFDESFQDRITIQAIASVCHEMEVTVDCDTNKIKTVYFR